MPYTAETCLYLLNEAVNPLHDGRHAAPAIDPDRLSFIPKMKLLLVTRMSDCIYHVFHVKLIIFCISVIDLFRVEQNFTLLVNSTSPVDVIIFQHEFHLSVNLRL